MNGLCFEKTILVLILCLKLLILTFLQVLSSIIVEVVVKQDPGGPFVIVVAYNALILFVSGEI